MGCSGISWTVCKQSAPRSRQRTTPTPHHSISLLSLYRIRLGISTAPRVLPLLYSQPKLCLSPPKRKCSYPCMENSAPWCMVSWSFKSQPPPQNGTLIKFRRFSRARAPVCPADRLRRTDCGMRDRPHLCDACDTAYNVTRAINEKARTARYTKQEEECTNATKNDRRENSVRTENLSTPSTSTDRFNSAYPTC